MKKSIIAAGAASVALAAMPILGAFAADTPVTDTINAKIGSGCSVTAGGRTVPTINVIPGNTSTSAAGTSASFVCNNSTWGVTAVGAGEVPAGYSAGQITDLIATHTGETTTYDRIATGDATSGATSNWAFKVSNLIDATSATSEEIASSKAVIAGSYNTFSAVPATATLIVDGKAGANVTMNTQYQVYASVDQAGGDYTGKVTYTIVEDATSFRS